MEDRRFTEIDLRRMLDRATGFQQDMAPGRWVIETRHKRTDWQVIVEPDEDLQALVVITAYPA
jgi:hypothetical protein